MSANDYYTRTVTLDVCEGIQCQVLNNHISIIIFIKNIPERSCLVLSFEASSFESNYWSYRLHLRFLLSVEYNRGERNLNEITSPASLSSSSQRLVSRRKYVFCAVG